MADPLAHLEGVIRNPNNANHMMAIKPIQQPVKVYAGDTLLADSAKAVRVMEIGRAIYDPVIYIPAEDVKAPLTKTERTTHCPLKGDASYYLLGEEELAWSYDAPLAFAQELAGYHAFWPSKVRVVEGT
ncbi:MAG: DUF427 domain-containing protein [Pseudomonadota bacterium]